MISDSIDHHHLYPYGAAWQKAFAFLRGLSPDTPTGKYVLDGTLMYAGIDVYATKTRETAKLETHRKYVDIQVLLSGAEVIDVYPKSSLTVNEPYDPGRDAEFYHVPETAPVRAELTPGRFLVFFPDDAHMPCLSVGSARQSVKKVVVKIAVELLVRA
jgi:YhcH/YjgK/YiaL family protein